MDDRKLKEYALKIFQGVSGYSLNKAFSLFPKYYPKIAFYYSELITNKQKELTTRTIQALGIARAIKIRKYANETNILIEQLTAYELAKMKSLDVYEKEFSDNEKLEEYKLNVIKENSNIIDNVTNIAKLNNQAFAKVVDEAKKYGYNNILDEAKQYLAKNNDLLTSIKDASKYYIEKLMNY